jgi:hypothetical protein
MTRNQTRQAKLSFLALESRAMPAVLAGVPADAVVVAPDDGGVPQVKIVDPATGEDVAVVQAYEDSFRGGVHASLGDVNGDGVRDLVIAPGEGGGPRVRVLDGASGATLADFFAYEPTYTGGVYVALGDVNGDGKADIITGTGVGGGPRVRVLDGATLGQRTLKDYFAYEDSFRGGVQVAAGDVNGDGRDDVVTGTGVGGGPRVVVFDGRDDRVLKDFFAYEDTFRGGVQVGAGDFDGDGRADVFVGSGAGGGPVARVVSGADDRELARVLADDAGFRGGVRVDSVDVNGDGADDLVCRVRRGNDDVVRVFDGRTHGFAGGVVRSVDDNPSPSDRAEFPTDRGGSTGGAVTAPAGTLRYVEGAVTAVDAAAGTVGVRTAAGTVVVVQTGAATEVKRNGAEAALATFVVGEKAEALLAADGVAVEIEARTLVARGGSNDSSTSAAGGSDDSEASDGGSEHSGGNVDGSEVSGGRSSGGGASNSGSGTSDGSTAAVNSRVEGGVAAVDPTARTVTLRTPRGLTVVVRLGVQTKVERNDRETGLASLQVGDFGEARIGSDGLATKIEAVGA